MSSNKDQAAFLKDAAKLILEAERFGLVVTGGELYRTQEQQDLSTWNRGNRNGNIACTRTGWQ
jgi:hypothetical protein